MASRTVLDDELQRSLVQAFEIAQAQGLNLTRFAEWLGLSDRRVQALLEGSAFTTRDIMKLIEQDLFPSLGSLTGRRGARYIKPMVFRPYSQTPCQIEDSAPGMDLGIDVEVEDILGNLCTLKLSDGVAQDIARWVEEHHGA